MERGDIAEFVAAEPYKIATYEPARVTQTNASLELYLDAHAWLGYSVNFVFCAPSRDSGDD